MKISYRPEIDGLRALAVGFVIFYHANLSIFSYKPFQGGFIGVDVFFTISGYLITLIILKELTTTGSFSFKQFYERRVRRILPVLFVVILVSLPFGWIYLLPFNLLDFSKSILSSLGFSSNFYFHYTGVEYAVGNYKNPFLHTWSLSVEEQFYILFPIALYFIFKYLKKYCLHILILFFISSLLLAEWTSKLYPSINFYFLHTRLWELLAGSILAFLEISIGRANKIKILNLTLPFFGLLLILYSVIYFDDDNYHPSIRTLFPIIGVCLIIWFANKNDLVTKLLSTKLFVGIGLISYSLYLWHYPIFCFVVKMNFYDGSLFSKTLVISAVFLSSIISYQFIEKPFRNIKVNIKRIIVLLSIKFLVIIVFCVHILLLKVHPFLTKYKNERRNLALTYNYNNFDDRKNVFIIGNSYANDLLTLFSYNSKLNKDYYFYNVLADDKRGNFQVKCLLDFLDKNKIFCDKSSFSFFKKQYEMADYIILAELLSSSYLKMDLKKIKFLIEREKKRFIVFLDDLKNADILDNYIYKKGKLPDPFTLKKIEKKFFTERLPDKKLNKLLVELKNKLIKNNIMFITRSKLYCDYKNQTCPLIKNNNKIYSDYGHLTDNGANYFSIKGGLIMEQLIKN